MAHVFPPPSPADVGLLPFSAFDAVVMAASTGGLDACTRLLRGLPAVFPAPLLLVQHRDPRWAELTPRILARRSGLPVTAATDGARMEMGTIYVAPPDRQLLLGEEGRLELPAAEDEPARDGRCAADPLFAAAATRFGARVIAVVLSGRLADGAAGIRAIKAHGGRVLVQDPATAQAPEMPLAAIATGCVDFVLTPERIAIALSAFVMSPGAADLFRVPLAPWARLA